MPSSGFTRSARLIALAGVLLVLFAPAAASADTRVGIALFGGYNTYSMNDVNEMIREINSTLSGGAQLDEIKDSWGYGGGLRVRPAPLLFAFDFERLVPGSELEYFGATVDVDVSANAFTGTLFYLFPSESSVRLGLGAGAGYYGLSGAIGADSAGVGVELDLEGSGVGFHALAVLDFAFSSVVHLEGMAGYRFAETNDLKVAGETAYKPDGEKAKLEWSGFMSRAGLTLYFGTGASMRSARIGQNSSAKPSRALNGG